MTDSVVRDRRAKRVDVGPPIRDGVRQQTTNDNKSAVSLTEGIHKSHNPKQQPANGV